MVAGEDPQATGVLRQGRGNAVFGREVGDAVRCVWAEGLVPGISMQVVAQVIACVLHPGDVALVSGELVETVGRHFSQHAQRVIADPVPELGIESGKDVARGLMP